MPEEVKIKLTERDDIADLLGLMYEDYNLEQMLMRFLELV